MLTELLMKELNFCRGKSSVRTNAASGLKLCIKT